MSSPGLSLVMRQVASSSPETGTFLKIDNALFYLAFGD